MSIAKTLLEIVAQIRSEIQPLKKAEEKPHLIKNVIVKGIVVSFIVEAIVATALTFTTTLYIPAMIELVAGICAYSKHCCWW
ncbi:MAG: hypothetical protein ACR5K2_03725 [Wolbachia sp.]